MSKATKNQNDNDHSALSGQSILLKEVTKKFPGQKKPAVDGVTLEIPAGKIVMFVGPSGCGKTTTLKMINRLIEPTEGSILIDDEDVTQLDGNQLRRRIGYVIQAGGLFPHMTVAQNIAVVPKMLGWDKARIARRVDELLDLVSLDPEIYRNRFPRELSGGQQQRVGVARGLAADPPVLLMDEPFGAVDPITRQRLQDELLRIQEELHKTIICVTHDFDEAVKLGDWVVVFNEGAQIVQYDTPERILAAPADEFVEGFIGSGAGLKQLTLSRVSEVELHSNATVKVGSKASDAQKAIRASNDRQVVVLDDRERPIQWLDARQLERIDTIGRHIDTSMAIVSLGSTLNDALDSMLVANSATAVVTGRRDAYVGTITVETVMKAIEAAREQGNSEDHHAPVGMNTGSIPVVISAEAHLPDDADGLFENASQTSSGPGLDKGRDQ